jgi:hypothetical protein
MAQEEFGAGTIFPKPGNTDVLVFKIGSRQVLTDIVVPFLQEYMRFSARVSDYETFATVVYLINLGWHRTREGLEDLVRLAYTMNANGKHRRVRMEEILDRILRGHTLNVLGQSEDMVRPPRRRGELDGTETVWPAGVCQRVTTVPKVAKFLVG